MSFHLGKPVLVMIAIALITAPIALFRPAQHKADLTFWVFADSHFKTFSPLIPEFERDTGLSVNMNLVQNRAMNIRLSSQFLTRPMSDQLPDLVEIEIGSIG